MARPQLGSTFPRNVFVRSPNFISNVYDRIGDRTDCFDATMIHLTERFNGKEVFLIGTANASTMLAQRTQKLIRDVNPDTVMVQTTNRWWDVAKMLKYVKSQEELTFNYKRPLDETLKYKYGFTFRRLLFITRIYSLTIAFKSFFGIRGWDPLAPGLEIKFACEEAEACGAKLEFLGNEMDQETYQRLLHETRFNVLRFLYKKAATFYSKWWFEARENKNKISFVGPRAFTEQCLDEYLMNWYIQAMDLYFPETKRIFVDKRDDDFFRRIDLHPGKKIVVVVNQWHLEGIEHSWCTRYGQRPRNLIFDGEINPIGDMDLRRGLFYMLYNKLHRSIASSNSKSMPSTYASWMTGYNRETVLQYEHRDM